MIRRLKDIYYTLLKVPRALQYFMLILRQDWSFDYSSTYALLLLKFRTLYAVMSTDPYHEYDAEIRSLRTAITILQRLTDEDDWYYRTLRRHAAKWGPIQYWMTPNSSVELYSYHTQKAGAVFARDAAQEKKEFWEAHELATKIKARDKRVLFAIMDKYMETWWA